MELSEAAPISSAARASKSSPSAINFLRAKWPPGEVGSGGRLVLRKPAAQQKPIGNTRKSKTAGGRSGAVRINFSQITQIAQRCGLGENRGGGQKAVMSKIPITCSIQIIQPLSASARALLVGSYQITQNQPPLNYCDNPVGTTSPGVAGCPLQKVRSGRGPSRSSRAARIGYAAGTSRSSPSATNFLRAKFSLGEVGSGWR